MLLLRIVATWTAGIGKMITREFKNMHHAKILYAQSIYAIPFYIVWQLYDYFTQNPNDPLPARLFNFNYTFEEYLLLISISIVNSFTKNITTMAY